MKLYLGLVSSPAKTIKLVRTRKYITGQVHLPILPERLISEDGGARRPGGRRLCADRSGAETLNPQTLSDHLFSKQAACQLAHVSIKTP